LALNPGITNVETFREAIMDYEGTVKMGAAGLGCSVTRLSCRENEIEVPCTTIRSFISRHQIPDPLFIKMDVEGAESLILRDPEFFEERKPDLYVSTHKVWWSEGALDTEAQMEIVRKIGRLYKNKIAWKGQFYAPDIDGAFSEVLLTDRPI